MERRKPQKETESIKSVPEPRFEQVVPCTTSYEPLAPRDVRFTGTGNWWHLRHYITRDFLI